MTYREIAGNEGYEIMQVLGRNEWFWFNDSLKKLSKKNYSSIEGAWRACCEENDL